MLPRLLLLILFLPALLQAQVARNVSVDLESGIIARLDTTNKKHDDGDVIKSHARLLEMTDVQVQDFSASFLLMVDSSQVAEKVSLLRAEAWSLDLVGKKDLRFRIHVTSGAPLELTAPLLANLPSKPELHHIAVSVKRDARQSLTGVWVDGVEVITGLLPPGPITVKKSSVVAGDEKLRGVVADVRLYDRALSRPEIIALSQQLPHPSKSRPKGMYNFELQKDEVIALLGGSEAVTIAEEGSLESLLMLSYAAQKPKFRSLAWETDTVFRQDRPLNFGDLMLQLRRCEATCVFLIFGRQECLERGESGVEEFRVALEKMIETCKAVTPRLVIIEAAPFEKSLPPLPDLSTKNAALAKYNEVLQALAEKHGAFFSSSGEGWNHQRPYRLTSDGVNLTRGGAQELGLRVLTSARLMERPDVTELRPLIQAKNKLWHEYWRPSNWAFLYGDRTAQPSSRDHLNPQVRWFPKELEKYQALIKTQEEAIWKQAEDLGRKVP
ncbi:MAG: LamG-like jellyroll fold domain-containing protein [Prosthecobacter sp.]